MGLKTVLAALLVGASTASATVKAVRPVAAGTSAPAVVAPVTGLTTGLAAPAGLSASLAPSLSAPNDAPKPADVLRAQAAETVAAWKAERAAAPRAAPAAAPALTPAEAIAAADSVGQALTRLAGLGVIKAEDVPSGETDRVALLKRVWDGEVTKGAAALPAVDGAWAVPALKVERGGRTYYVHGVAHGQLYPPNRRDVTRLVAQIKEKGEALYSEQGIPLHYGFAYGLETMDHEVGESNGVPARVAEAAGGLSSGGIAAAHALLRWSAVGGVAWSWLRAALAATDPSLWLLAGGATLALLLVARGLQPLLRLSALADARRAEGLGSTHLAEQLRREAAAFFKPRVAPEDILRLHLPPGPGAAVDSLSPRSAAIAAAAAASAAAAVHVLVGYRHAAEIAWRLAGKEGPRPSGPRSQES